MRSFRDFVFKACVAASAFLSLFILSAWGSSWGELRASMATIKTIRADFVQTRRLDILGRPLVSKGRFYYRYPDELRWEYTAPVRQVLLMRKGKIKRFRFRGARFVEVPSVNLVGAQTVMSQIVAWMRGSFKKNAALDARLISGETPIVELRASTAEFAMHLKKITIRFGKAPGSIRDVEIMNSKSDSTSWTFLRRHINEKIPESVFLSALSTWKP